MFNYLKSFFFTGEENVDNRNVKYELVLTWYSNFTQYKNIIKSAEFDINTHKDEDVLNEHFGLYHKLSIQYRLIDYLHRMKLAMFSDNFIGGRYHLNSLKIKKGSVKEGGRIEYGPPIVEAEYDISIEVDAKHNWEII